MFMKKLESGDVVIPADEQKGRPLLKHLLRELKIPESSQVLVFSKTSLQRRAVRPENPRAIYFNEDVYLGWMPGGRVEIGSVDPELGSIFYFQRDFDDDPELPLFYRDEVCIQCHAGSATNFLPGPLGRSVFPNESGRPTATMTSFDLAGHEVKISDRWGGWYVTGSHGSLRHMGNALAARVDGKLSIDKEKYANLEDLNAFFQSGKFPADGSDFLALLLLDHQIGMHYRLMEAHYRVRQALYDKNHPGADGEPRSDLNEELETATEMVVNYLFFCDEASLGAEEIATDSTYRKTFLADRRADSKGRSLRDLRLRDHIFQYRCSYMIYSSAFTGLPEILRKSVFGRMKEILSLTNEEEEFAHLKDDEKAAIWEILKETVPEFEATKKVAER